MAGSGIGTLADGVGGPTTASITLKQLRDRVDRKLANYSEVGAATDSGDGLSYEFRLPHRNIISSGLVVTVDDFAGVGTLDETSGWYTFTSPPVAQAVIAYQYQYKHWSDEQTNDAINSGIGELFGRFYVRGHSLVTTTGAQEYAAESSAGVALSEEDRITRVEYFADPHWVKSDRWSVRHEGTAKYLHFENAPTSGLAVRISYTTIPGELVGDSTTLVSIGLPERAKEPLVLYAASDLIASRIAPRIRDDRANNTQNDNAVKSYEMINDSQFFRSLAELKAERIRMPRQNGRVVL